MNKFIRASILSLACLTLCCEAAEPEVNANASNQIMEEIITFNPPKGWKKADLESFSPLVKMVLVGTPKEHFPPTITLVVEPYKGTLKDYLKIVKNINLTEKTEWKDLGKIHTKEGSASLSQFDEISNWGITRTMTTILVKNDTAYILSATALKSEFSDYYKEFFEAMRSLKIKKPS